MSTNGASNGQGNGDRDRAPFPDLELDPEMLAGGYVGFEQVVGTLMWACMENDLRLYGVSSRLETTTLEREFRASCVLDSWQYPHDLRASLGFAWPAENTTLSIYGDAAFCALYHAEDEPCEHLEGSAEVFMELEVSYHLPSGLVDRLNSDEGIAETSSRVQKVFAEVVDHDNMVCVEAKAIYNLGKVSLVAMEARHQWMMEEEMRSLPLLSGVLLSICGEIHQVLQRFALEFGGADQGGSGR